MLGEKSRENLKFKKFKHKLHKQLCPIVILLGRKQAPVCLDLEISHTTSIELKENDSKERKSANNAYNSRKRLGRRTVF